MRGKVFSERVIFHHIPKTAGTAINIWLRARLGAGCVTEPLIGEHRRLIACYGGQYSIIFAHIGFGGEGLDPRYRYVTLLRHPVERMISWLFFVLNNNRRESLIQEWGWDIQTAVKQFLDSEGETLDERLLPVISNEMVQNFASILNPSPASDAERLDLALSAVRQYDLVGIYEELPAFLRRLAAMLGLPYEPLKPVNVTQKKPSQISPKLREKLHALNRLALEFYRQVKDLAQKQPEPVPSEVGWQPWSGFGERRLQASCLEQVEADLLEGASVRRGELLRFSLKFSLTEPLEELEPGIHIFDEDRRWAFGTNTTLLGQPLRQLAPGSYQDGFDPEAMDLNLSRKPMVSIVVPFHNEEETIDLFYRALVPVMDSLSDFAVEVVCVDDGSQDHTLGKLLELVERDSRFRVIELSRNFGKEAALTAGIDAARGDAVIPMDADLQDPPDLIPVLVEKWRQGAEVVLARRIDRSSDSFLKRKTAEWFYRLHNRISNVKIPENVGDFRLLDRVAVEALKRLPERQRFMKGLFAWVGFKTAVVDYSRNPRVAGSTNFSGWKLWNFALEGITSFSIAPLIIWTYLGGLGAFLALAYASYIVIRTLIYGIEVPGYASLFVAILFFGSVQLMGLGMLGEYIGRIYMETKQRPIYIVRRRYEKNDSEMK